ncbi:MULTISPECIES: pyrroline-5-carboxylate reductase [Rhodomicrobium]|uniref:pyrroline-5-carboxylate reductase n=1 Tax=Rhodomicrobium TaxID=1068 RepID=UPI000B4AB319|nr:MULTISPECIES: pyrroline-5-carboxylate reductase [Rhodomicrobium]
MSETANAPILLVGAGRMGGALLKGWLAQGIEPGRIFVEDPSPGAGIARIIAEAGLGTGVPPVPPGVIVLAVKPQLMDQVLPGVAPMAGPDTVVLSIAAGRTIAAMAAHFTQGIAIVRAMPNTPAAIGRGISALYANDTVRPEQAQLCERLLAAAGETVWLDDEAQMDAVTAVSGSGPAYVFLLAECLAEAGVAAGLAPELAARLARATVSGAGELLHQSELDPAELRKNVTSPGGTTAAALAVLMGEPGAADAPLRELLRKAVDAAARRSRDLAS